MAETTGAAITAWFDSLQASLDYVAGRWDEAAAAADRILPQDRLGARARATCLLVRGSIRRARGQTEPALADAAAARAATDPRDTRYRHATLALQGRCLLAAERREEADAALEELLAEQRKRPAESCVTTDAAALLLDLGHPADALPDGLAPTRWHQAVQALVAQDFPRAVGLLETIGSEVDAAAARARLRDA